jgi:hypothetical protein
MEATLPESTRRLRATGWSRYVDAAFVFVWLGFWIAGEIVGLALLVAMLASAVFAALGRPLALTSRIAPTDGSVSLFLLFMLLWTALWTAGGIAAATHALRRISGEDSVEITGTGLGLVRRAGPFRRRREIARASIRRVRVRPRNDAVVLDTDGGTLVLSDLGTSEQRASLRQWIAERLDLSGVDRALLMERETPPRDRDVNMQGAETILTFPSRRARAIRSRVVWGLAAICSLGWINVIWRSGERTLSAGESTAAAVTLVVAAVAIWLTGERAEWIVRPGWMRLRRCFLDWTLREQSFEVPSTLEIEYHQDSDGDDRYTLVIKTGTRRRVLGRALFDPYELAALAEWLAAHTAFPFQRSPLESATSSVSRSR